MKFTFSSVVLIIFLLLNQGLQANDCSSAANLTLNNPTAIVLDACDNADLAGGIYPCANCDSDAWFTIDLGGTNLVQQHVRFNIEANGTAELNAVLLYSDSWEESGDICTWSNATAALGLQRNINVCNITITGIGDIYELDSYGLDGSGKYVLLIEKTTTPGSATTITVTPQILGTCNAPSNDRCSSPLALGSGNGIDPMAPSPNVPAWSDAIKASTACGTKQRISRATVGDPGTALVITEDHYDYKPFGQPRRYTGNIGDGGKFLGSPTSQADTYLENTLYYSFTVPGTGTNSDWKLAIGNSGGCSQEPNDMVVMILNNLDCSDADNSAPRASQKVSMDNGLAAGQPSYTFTGLTLTGGNTYYIVVDGTRASQCDFCMLLYNGGLVNPVLPAELSNFNGYNQGSENILLWETSLEENHDYFSVERSLDGESFEEIGRVQGIGNAEAGNSYSFIDPAAKVGLNYYRLNMIDIDGSSYYSRSIQILRDAPSTALISLFPNPAKSEVELYFSSEEDGTAYAEILDIKGRRVMSTSFKTAPGEQKEKIRLDELAAGIYAVKFQMGNYVKVQKLIKQ
ncbi:MAG: T9SS type A sorting domain-containing protein [Bacteroidota bacterium]